MWLALRLLILTAALVSGCLFDPMGDLLEGLDVPAMRVLPPWVPSVALWALLLGAACVLPLLVLAAVGVQAINPLGRGVFQEPGWDTNFLDLRDPAHFFHLAGYAFVVAGVGRTAVDLYAHTSVGHSGMGWLAAGLAFLAGVRLCRRVFKKRYKSNQVQS